MCILIASALSAGNVFAQGPISGQVIGGNGIPIAYGQVRVCAYGSSGIPCSPKSSIYSDLALSQSISNPYTTDQFGNYTFFAASGNYIVQVSSSSGFFYSYFWTIYTNGGSGPLTITSFTGGQFGEIGQSFVNPVFSATYSGTPTSASITNTDSINSPFTLSSPYTSATITGTFTHSTTATTTFTLTASNGSSSPTATQTITWKQRIFGGDAPTGATSTVTALGTNAVLSTGTISSAALGVETVGETFGPYSPSGQAVYLLLAGGSHTFTDATTGFPFAFNSPIAVTFVNQFGVSFTMYLYQSTNSLYGTFQPKVAS